MAMIAALLVAILLAPTPAPAFGADRTEPTAKAPWNATWTDNLKRALLVGYDKFSRPSDHKVSTNVTLGLAVYHVDLDDKSAVMTMHVWIKMAWNDEKLKWNASDYGGLESIHIADHEIWQPDIIQYNSASGNAVDQYGNTHCIVSKDGSVLWVPPAKITTYCDLDLTKWPQDEHTCIFTFGSWTYDGIQINLDMRETISVESNAENYIENGEWELIQMTQRRDEKIYSCCEEPYISIDYGIQVRRRGGGGARGVLVRAPLAAAALLSLLSHCLPPRSPLAPRLPLAAASPAIISLSLLYYGYRLPAAETTPNIVMLYCISLYMVCISGIVSVIVLNMTMARKALPWVVRRALCSGVARCLRLPKLADNSVAEELQGSVGSAAGSSGGEDGTRILSGSPPPARDWLALATALDRITFIALLFVFIIIAIVYGC